MLLSTIKNTQGLQSWTLMVSAVWSVMGFLFWVLDLPRKSLVKQQIQTIGVCHVQMMLILQNITECKICETMVIFTLTSSQSLGIQTESCRRHTATAKSQFPVELWSRG